MYFPDLSPYEHCWPAEYEAAFCGLPVRNMGWLSADRPVPTGEVPEDLPARLLDLCATQLWQNPGLHLMGFHNCEFCPVSLPGAAVDAPGHGRIHLGSDEIRVLGRNCAYAAPNLIYHYVTAHRYQPPDDFIAAVLKAPARQSRALEMYSYHLWEATLHSLRLNFRGEYDLKRASLGCRPGSLAGSMLGRLVMRYRMVQGASVAGLGLLLLVSKPVAARLGLWWQPALVTATFLGLALLLAAVYWADHLPCPFCGAALKPGQAPGLSKRRRQWHDRFQSSTWLFCDSGHWSIKYRLSPFPWSSPPCHLGSE